MERIRSFSLQSIATLKKMKGEDDRKNGRQNEARASKRVNV